MLEARLARISELRQWQARRGTAEKSLEENPEEPKTNLVAARFYCLGRNDWAKGLTLLAKANYGRLSAAAANHRQTGLECRRRRPGGCLVEPLGKKGLTETQSLLYREAACHWYEEPAALSENDYRKIEPRLIPPGSEAVTNEPFAVPMHGLAGTMAMAPRSVKGKVLPSGGFATIQGGRVDIEYPQVSAMSYVCDLDVKPLGMGGSANFSFGGDTEFSERQPVVGQRLGTVCMHVDAPRSRRILARRSASLPDRQSAEPQTLPHPRSGNALRKRLPELLQRRQPPRPEVPDWRRTTFS